MAHTTPIHADDDQRRYILRPTTIWTTTTGRTSRVSMRSTPPDARVNEAPTASASPVARRRKAVDVLPALGWSADPLKGIDQL
jgi:hypothetical protein